MPLGVRKRYEALFNANVLQCRRADKQKLEDRPALLSPGESKGRRAVGWRGLSVDLITGDNIVGTQHNQGGDKIDLVVGGEDTLDGAVVKVIWQKSGVDKERLSEIWCVELISFTGIYSYHLWVGMSAIQLVREHSLWTLSQKVCGE